LGFGLGVELVMAALVVVPVVVVEELMLEMVLLAMALMIGLEVALVTALGVTPW